MPYRMVAIDLDGTLLTDDKRVSEGNLAELRRVIAQGVHVIISTGRAWPGAKPFVRILRDQVPAAHIRLPSASRRPCADRRFPGR